MSPYVALSIILPLLWLLYLGRAARGRLTLAPKHPDKPYDISDCYVIGGRWGISPHNSELGYECYKFANAMTAVYMCAWLNDPHDHRSLAMAFFDWDAQVAAQRLKQERAHKAKVAEERAKLETLQRDPCYCNSCDRYLDRDSRRTTTFLRTGRCPECEMKWQERKLVATFQVPSATFGNAWQATGFG